MSLFRLSVTTLVVALTACQATTAPSTSATATGTLRGKAKLDGESSSRGITVLLSGPSSRAAVTLDDGVYEFTKIEPGTYVVTASAPSTEPSSVSTTATVSGSGNAEAAELVLKPFGTITGTATLGTATGNAGIAVSVAGSPTVTVTDDAGHFTLTRVPTGARTVVASYPGFTSATSSAVTVRYDTSVEAPAVTLSRATYPGAIQGTVKLTGEEKHDGISISVSGPAGGSAVTDMNGAYSITGLPPGKYLVTAAARSTVEAVLSVPVNVTTELAQASELAFTPLGSVSGHVTLGAATGNAGIVVTLTGTSSTTVTADDGSFTLNNVPTGTWNLAASFPGYVSGSTPSVKVAYAKTTSLTDLVLSKTVETGKIQGKVTLNYGTTPIGTAVTLSGPMSAVALTTMGGNFEFTGLKAGDYTLLASVPSTDEGTVSARVGVDSTQVASSELVFTALGSVSGKATLGTATGNAGITVAVPGKKTMLIGITDDAGNYVVNGVPSGTGSAMVSYPGYNSATISNVIVEYAKSTTIPPLTLTRATQPGSINGVAKVAGETTQPAMTVQLSGPTSSTTQTDASGAYSFLGLPPGQYTVTVHAPSTEEATLTTLVTVTTTTATATALNFTPLGTITGTATLAGQTNHAGIAVSVPGTQLTAYTDAAGTFTIRGVSTGTRSVFASTPGYGSASSASTLVRYAQTSTITPALTLSPNASAASPSINGVATILGRMDYSGTTVSIVGTGITTTTAADGSYVLQNPPPGMLTLQFTNGGFSETLSGVLSMAGTNGQIFSGNSFIPLAPIEIPASKRLFTGGAGMLPSLTYSKDNTVAVYTETVAGKRTLKVVSLVTGLVTTLVNDLDLYRFTTDGQRVLYTTRNSGGGTASTLWTIPITGGSPTILSTNLTYLGSLSEDNSALYFTTPALSGSGYDVKVVAAAGGLATTLATLPTSDFYSDGTKVGFIQLTANGLFLVYTSGGTLYSVPTSGSATPTTLATGSSSTAYLSPASNYVLYRPSGTSTGLMSVAITGGTPNTILATGSYGYFDGFSPNGAYVAFDVSSNQFIAPIDGSSAPVNIGAATSATSVGWVNDGQGTPGVVWRASGNLYYNAVAGGTPLLLVSNVSSTNIVSPDGRTVYATSGNGSILSAFSIPSGIPRQITDAVSTSFSSDTFKLSPDGTRLMFTTEDTGGRTLMVIPSAGGVATPVLRTFDGASTEWIGSNRVRARRLSTPAPYQFQDGLYVVSVP